LQDPKNRQNSVEVSDDHLEALWADAQNIVKNEALKSYRWAIDHGIAKEQARSVLPEGLTESVLIMKGSLRSWIHYCILRMAPETQREHRIVAEQCWEIITEQFPDIVEAFNADT